MREAILRGVYEENLKIVGKYRPHLVARRHIPSKKLLFLSFLVLLVLADYQRSAAPTFLSDRHVAANMVQETLVPTPPEQQESPAEYRALLGGGDIPLSRIFGLSVKTIMIDPGHGGTDTGTRGALGTLEKDITLDIARRLKGHLDRHGRYNVIMTREEDVTLPLSKRVALARESRADLFISVHLNYLPAKPINIVETYYFGPPSDRDTLKLVETENAGSEYGLSDFKELITKLSKTMKLEESREFAASIQRNLFLSIREENEKVLDYGIKRAPFVVLLGVDVPAVLAEVSCLSNREEEHKLNTEGYREHVARSLEAGIRDYLQKGEIRHEAKRYAKDR